MKTLEMNKLEIYTAGNFTDGLCEGIAAGSVVYTAGVLFNWWNPVGWVSGGFLVADGACAYYGLTK